MKKSLFALKLLLFGAIAVTAAPFGKKSNKRRKVYLSGPISGLSKNEYLSRFSSAERAVRDSMGPGVVTVSPTSLRPFMGLKSWLFYMVPCVRSLLLCDDIYMLDGWRSSKGARIEYFLAKAFGLRVLSGSYGDIRVSATDIAELARTVSVEMALASDPLRHEALTAALQIMRDR